MPARVVVGYQGGKYNDPEPYLIVSQSDAHAWVEVWQQGLGWVGYLTKFTSIGPYTIVTY